MGRLSRARRQFRGIRRAGSDTATLLPFFRGFAIFVPHLASNTAELGKN